MTRHASFPVGESTQIGSEDYKSFCENWESYTDQGTVESVGLEDGSKLMFEYALFNKDESL